jgi:cation-transporting P-type ATPase D
MFRNKKSDQEIISSPQANSHLDTITTLSTRVPDLKLSPCFPDPLKQTQCSYIDDPLQLAAAATRLAAFTRLALDIEHHSTHTYYGQSCLIQLSDGCEDYIIDAIALRSVIASTLGPLFSNPKILKVVHGGGSDVIWLLRDFGIRLINIFDTEKCCKALGYPPKHRSLRFLCSKFVDIRVDKTLQMADWRQRPLSTELMEYARSDVHWLLYIADCLGKELDLGAGKKTQPRIEDTESLLGRAVHRSQSLSLLEYSPPLPRVAASAAAAGIMKNYIATLRSSGSRGSGETTATEKTTTAESSINSSVAPFDDNQIQEITDLSVRVHALCVWRDTEARKIDEGVACVLPDDVLVTVSEQHYANMINSMEDLGLILKEKYSSDVKYANACMFPDVAIENAATIIKELHAAGAGQRPWAHPYVLEALKSPKTLEKAAKRRHEDPEAFKERLGERFGVKKQVYENCRMLSKSGTMLCFTDKKRLLWYIRKGLAEEVDPGKEPLTVRLTFDHKDDDQRAGAHEFYSSKRSNTCVACGSGKHYLRYRVVPVCYRRALPEKFKSHRSHDVLLLCVGCHEVAQRAAEQMKREISSEYGVPLFPRLDINTGTVAVNGNSNGNINGSSSACDEEKEEKATTRGGDRHATLPTNPTTTVSTTKSMHPFSVRKAAVALDRVDTSTLPTSRREELELVISTYVRAVEPWLGNVPSSAPFSQDDLWAGLLSGMSKATRRKAIRRWIAQGHKDELPLALLKELEMSGTEGCNSSIDIRDGMGHSWHGQKVVEAALEQGGDDALSNLCARFRQAFIEALQPKYLPAGWKVNHTAPRTFGQHSIYTNSADADEEIAHENGHGIVNGDNGHGIVNLPKN